MFLGAHIKTLLEDGVLHTLSRCYECNYNFKSISESRDYKRGVHLNILVIYRSQEIRVLRIIG